MKTRQRTRDRVVGQRWRGGAVVAQGGWVDVVVMRCNFPWSRCQALTQGACSWTNYTVCLWTRFPSRLFSNRWEADTRATS